MRDHSPETHLLARPDAVNAAHTVERCRVLGPGERFVLWVQGCPMRCLGCHNPQFQPFEDRTWLPVGVLVSRVLSVPGSEGVTLVGGEPFAQARALARLARSVRGSGRTVVTYTGYTLEQLESGVVPHADELLGETDLLVDGPYHRELPTQRPWRGSDNQRLIPLSDRYRDQVSQWNQPTGQQFEVRVSSEGGVEILGIPPANLSGQPRTVNVSRTHVSETRRRAKHERDDGPLTSGLECDE